VSRLLTPSSDGVHITPQDSQAYALGWCKIIKISYVLLSCYLWCPPPNLFASNKVSSSTRCARCVWHSQDFMPRAQNVYEKHFHDTKSWPLCYKSPATAPSAIAFLHSKVVKKNPLVKFQKSEILVTYIQILIYYLTFIQTRASQSKSFHAPTIKSRGQ